MRGRSRSWDDITADAFLAFDEDELEQLCRELLDIEVRERHPEADVDGPPPKSVGGKDLGVHVKRAPLVSTAAYEAKYTVRALTSDAVGRTVYSCKSGKNFRRDALEEARKKSAWAVEALREGGRFVLFVNRCTDGDAPSAKPRPPRSTTGSPTKIGGPPKKLLDDLAEAYADRTGLPVAVIAERIAIFDANNLRAYLAGRKPEGLRLAFRDKLGVAPIPRLLTLDTWCAGHEEERGEPHYEWDEARERIKAALVASLDASSTETTTWIVGAPGVGKTRLIVETLRSDARLAHRAHVALSAADGRQALGEHMLHERRPDAILVVDDCAPHELDALLPWMNEHNGHGRGRLIVLTPMSPSSSQLGGHGKPPMPLPPLAEPAVRALVAREIGHPESSDRVEEIVRWTEGYPWFAVLVAREVGEGAPLPRSAAEAADLALCSPRDPGFVVQRLRLARVLFLAMLTANLDWADLGDGEREALCKAVGLDRWSEVEEGRQACVTRGLLRLRLGLKFKYVTPAILEREIARKLLTPPPDGPEPIGPLLKRFARRHVPALFQRLEKLGLDARELAGLARPVLAALGAMTGLEGLGREGVSGAELAFAARHAPGETARALRQHLESATLSALLARTDIRRDLVDALSSLAGRRATFEDAEAALFRLALVENEVYGNNATGVWSSLFFVELNNTYRTYAEKLPVLRRRCTTGEPAARLIGLQGVAAALTTRGSMFVGGALDGPYPTVTYQDAEKGRLDAWKLLVECLRDPDERVASRARDIARDELRGALRTGHVVVVAGLLERALDAFDEPSRRGLREQVAFAEAHDREWIEQASGAEAWASFVAALRPTTYSARLHQVAGEWGPDGERGPEDEALAREGLSLPEVPVLAELGWLASTDAKRSTPFMIALGSADIERALVDALIARAREGSPDLIAAYLLGVLEAGRAEDAAAELSRLQSDPALAEAACLAIWRLGATDERVAWLTAAICEDQISDRVLGLLVLGNWEESASDEALGALLGALLDRRSDETAAVALNLVVHRIKDADGGIEPFRGALVRALERVTERELSGRAAHWWKLGAIQLAKAGGGATALDLAILALRLDSTRSAPQEAVAVLRECASRDPRAVWSAVSLEMERDMEFGYALLKSGILSQLDAIDVLDWVRDDDDRAARVARLVGMHGGEALHPIARGLIQRFQGESRAARILAASVRSTPRAVGSLEEFTRKQLVRVERWRGDADPEVRAWAMALHDDLTREAEHHAAHEEYDRRHWGIAG